MDKTLEEAMQDNAATREKVVALQNSMILDPLPFYSNSSNPQLAKLTSSLPGEAVADMSKAGSSEHLQPSSDAPSFDRNVAIALAGSLLLGIFRAY